MLISGCLGGLKCGVDGTDYGLPKALPGWLSDSRVRVVRFCPEDFELGTPRTMPDLHGGDGFDVLDSQARVLDENGADLTASMIAGARAMLKLAQQEDIDFAILTDRSGACGTQVISIGCRYEEPVGYRRGVGVAAALLIRHGLRVVSQRDHRTLGRIGERLGPEFAAQQDALDFHETPWVVANLPVR